MTEPIVKTYDGYAVAHFPPRSVTIAVTRERGYPGVGPGDPPGWVHSDIYRRALTHVLRDGKPTLEYSDVLDAGCGGGYGLRMLCDAGVPMVYGVDTDEGAVLFCRAYETRACVAEAGLDELPYRDAWLHAALCIEAIEHVDAEEQAAAFGEFARVLRTGGKLIMSTPERGVHEPSEYHVRELQRYELRGLYEGAGFEVTELGEIKHMPGTLFAVGVKR